MLPRDKRNKDADRFVYCAMCVFKSISRQTVSIREYMAAALENILSTWVLFYYFFAFKNDHETPSLIHLLMWPMPSSLLLNLTCSLIIKLTGIVVRNESIWNIKWNLNGFCRYEWSFHFEMCYFCRTRFFILYSNMGCVAWKSQEFFEELCWG